MNHCLEADEYTMTECEPLSNEDASNFIVGLYFVQKSNNTYICEKKQLTERSRLANMQPFYIYRFLWVYFVSVLWSIVWHVCFLRGDSFCPLSSEFCIRHSSFVLKNAWLSVEKIMENLSPSGPSELAIGPMARPSSFSFKYSNHSSLNFTVKLTAEYKIKL
jgi:hypothetical protein